MIQLDRLGASEIAKALHENFRSTGEVPVLMGMTVTGSAGGSAIVTSGSSATFLGRPIATMGSTYQGVLVAPGSTTGMQPCVGVFTTGSRNVFIGGKPMLIVGSMGVHTGIGGPGTAIATEGAFAVATPLAPEKPAKT